MPTKKRHSVSDSGSTVSRHERNCRVCAHAERDEIEREFLAWGSAATIARDYKFANRASIYRHAHAFDLFNKRRRNLWPALDRIIEHAGDIRDVSAAAVVSAVQTLARINAQGQWIERSDLTSQYELFDRMTVQEKAAYVRDGSLPDWFCRITGTSTPEDPKGAK